MKRLALIPARGGSKRIPKKNIKLFLGVPVIKYSIDAALGAGCFEEVMVSTDDREIGKLAAQFGAKVPFYRSEASSGDLATTSDVVGEVLSEYRKKGVEFDYVCCLYPTAPFITAKILNDAMTELVNGFADSLVPVVKFDYPIQRALSVEGGKLKSVYPKNMLKRTQDLMTTYHDAGQFYCLRGKSFLEQKTIFMKNTIPMILSGGEVQDIDTFEDWEIAELKFRIKNRK